MVGGRILMRGGRITQFDEVSLLREIQQVSEELCPEFDAAEASVGPMRTAMEEIYRRSLALSLATPTFPARLPDA